MAIFGKIKKAFGFSETDYEAEENAFPSAAPIRRTPAPQQFQRPETNQPTDRKTEITPAPDTSAGDMPQYPASRIDDIFTSVVDIFNSSLPDFLKNSVDPEKQRHQLYEALSDSLKEYINKLEETAQKRTEIAWQSERSRLRQEMDNLQIQSRKFEDTNAEWQEQKLSAERQKRALSERVHDLEKQIAKFEAEKEQYELENKSLVNKLRATSIQESDLENALKENQQLSEELNRLRTGAEAPLQDNSEELEALQAALNEKMAEIETLHLQIDKNEEENKQLQNDTSLLKKKCEIADAMINDLNQRASAAQKSLAEREAQLAAMQAAKVDEESKSAESDETALELEAAKEEIERLTRELDESTTALNSFEESLDKFEEIKLAKDQVINQLQDKIKQQEVEMDNSLKEIESLKSTIENNLKLQAESELALRNEIENLRQNYETAKPKRKRKPKVSSIDESLDDTDWLIATPPEGTDARLSRIPDSEFGYQEPAKKNNTSENSSQMLLW